MIRIGDVIVIKERQYSLKDAQYIPALNRYLIPGSIGLVIEIGAYNFIWLICTDNCSDGWGGDRYLRYKEDFEVIDHIKEGNIEFNIGDVVVVKENVPFPKTTIHPLVKLADPTFRLPKYWMNEGEIGVVIKVENKNSVVLKTGKGNAWIVVDSKYLEIIDHI